MNPSSMSGENQTQCIKYKHLTPTVKHGGGMGGLFRLVLQPHEFMMNSCLSKYSGVKHETICLTAEDWFKLDHQQVNDPKHHRLVTIFVSFPQQKGAKVLQWSSQSLDHKLNKTMCWGINRAVRGTQICITANKSYGETKHCKGLLPKVLHQARGVFTFYSF